MTIYTVTFRSATRWAEQTIRARTPQGALAKAHKAFADDPLSLDWEDYHHDGLEMLEEIVVSDGHDTELAAWLREDCRRSLAASDLLDAAQAALDYLTDHAIDLEGEPEEILVGLRNDLADAIAKAKGGAP
jgi:hypothetical protein